MTRPDEIAALAAKLRRADVKRYPWLSFCIEVADDLDRLSATSPGDAVRDGWTSLGEDTSWLDGRDVVLLVRGMEVSARYCKGEWSDDTPISPREYSGPVWSCFDDEFQLEIEECSRDPKKWGHDGATHWRVPLALAPAEKDCKDHPSRRCLPEECCLTAPAEKAVRDYKHGYNDGVEWATKQYATPTPPSAGVDAAILAFARSNGICLMLTRDVGPYEITEPTFAARQFAKVIQSAAHGGGTKGGKCEMCFGTGRHEGRFGLNDALCSYCGGTGTKSDGGVEGHAISGTRSASEQSRQPETPVAGVEPGPSDPAQEPEAVALKPCPFCGCADLGVHQMPGQEMFWVSCHCCGLEAPSETGVTREQSVTYWNTRPVSLDREAVARIIDPVHLLKYESEKCTGRLAENGKLWADVAWGKERDAALAKADAILALGAVADAGEGNPDLMQRVEAERAAQRDGRTRLASEYGFGFKDGQDFERNRQIALSTDRDFLGQLVRFAWVAWAKTQEAPKAHWLLPYEELSETDKEADRQIGEALISWVKKYAPALVLPGPSDPSDALEYVKITGPAVDALDVRKESDDGPSEEQVTADARRFISDLRSDAGEEPVAWADSQGLWRPIDAEVKRQLLLNPTVKTYTDRFSIPLYLRPTGSDAVREMREALEIIDLYFAPWGAAKSAKWEHLTNGSPFAPEDALKVIQVKLRRALPSHGGEKVGER